MPAGRILREEAEPTEDEHDEAYRVGVDDRGYRASRGTGASHEECLDAHTLGVGLGSYAQALQAGATHAEILEAKAAGVDPQEYAWVCCAGGSHDEVLEFQRIGGNAGYYLTMRRAGATHAEILDASEQGVTNEGYARCRRSMRRKAAHAKILAAHHGGMDLLVLAVAEELGEEYGLTLEVQEAGIDLDLYAKLGRELGLDRPDVLEAHAANPELLYYASARRSGLRHWQAMALLPFAVPPNWVPGDPDAPWELASAAVLLYPEGVELIAALATDGAYGDGQELAEIARRLWIQGGSPDAI
jgi:hypothetical protein